MLGVTGLCGGLIVACLSGDLSPEEGSGGPEPPYLGPRSECSTGPAYTYDTKFSEGPRESPHPECIQRCGEHEKVLWGSSGGQGGPSPEIDAVPSGACQHEAEACSMVAVRRCCSPEGQTGQAFLFECRCKNKNWVCLSTFHGGGACSCGADAATPSTADEGGTTDAGQSSDADSGGD